MFFAPMGGGYDPITVAFSTATGIVDVTILDAIDNLILSLRANNLLARQKAIYVFVGGTAFTCKFNLLDARDLDVAFRLVFTPVWTFGATGITPNGTTAFAETFLVPSTELGTADGSLFVYSRTNSAQGYDIGASNDSGAVTNTTSLICRYTGNLAYGNYGNGSYAVNIASTDGRGGFMVNRNDGTNTTLWRNGIKLKTVAEAVNLTNRPLYIGAINTAGSPNFRSNKEYAYISVGGGYSDAEALTYYNIVLNFLTTLGKQA